MADAGQFTEIKEGHPPTCFEHMAWPYSFIHIIRVMALLIYTDPTFLPYIVLSIGIRKGISYLLRHYKLNSLIISVYNVYSTIIGRLIVILI